MHRGSRICLKSLAHISELQMLQACSTWSTAIALLFQNSWQVSDLYVCSQSSPSLVKEYFMCVCIEHTLRIFLSVDEYKSHAYFCNCNGTIFNIDNPSKATWSKYLSRQKNWCENIQTPLECQWEIPRVYFQHFSSQPTHLESLHPRSHISHYEAFKIHLQLIYWAQTTQADTYQQLPSEVYALLF